MQGAVTKQMSQEEALEILQIKKEEGKEEEPLHPDEILSRFDVMFEKNLPEKGGSFYIRSKIFFAKNQLMMTFPKDLDISKYNPGST